MPSKVKIALTITCFSCLVVPSYSQNENPTAERTAERTGDRDRVKEIGVVAVKQFLRAKLMREKRRVFRKNQDLIDSLELLLADRDNEVLKIWIADNREKFVASLDDQASAKELGDGKLLELWLEWLGSDGFKNFVDVLIPLIEKIFDLIGGISSVDELPLHWRAVLEPSIRRSSSLLSFAVTA